MERLTPDTVRELVRAAGLELPPERVELLARRLGPMIGATTRLSARMSHVDVPPLFSLHANAATVGRAER